MTLKGGMRWAQFLVDLRMYARTVWPFAILFGIISHLGRGVLLLGVTRVSHAPILRGLPPPFFVITYICWYLVTWGNQLWHSNPSRGEELFLGNQPRSTTRGGPHDFQFLGPLSTPTPFDLERPNWAGESMGACFWGTSHSPRTPGSGAQCFQIFDTPTNANTGMTEQPYFVKLTTLGEGSLTFYRVHHAPLGAGPKGTKHFCDP